MAVSVISVYLVTLAVTFDLWSNKESGSLRLKVLYTTKAISTVNTRILFFFLEKYFFWTFFPFNVGCWNLFSYKVKVIWHDDAIADSDVIFQFIWKFWLLKGFTLNNFWSSRSKVKVKVALDWSLVGLFNELNMKSVWHSGPDIWSIMCFWCFACPWHDLWPKVKQT
jgi:hypothetical protein